MDYSGLTLPELFNTSQAMGTDTMATCCLRARCNLCCQHTNMLLSVQDIERITSLGYDQDYFLEERNGWLQLKNTHGRCVFHTSERCSIYDDRPQGCRLYPIVYDADHGTAILDAECPQRQRFRLGKHHVHELMLLIATLHQERTRRGRLRRGLFIP
jgi:Fe-S-cluster containining protein